MHLVCGYAENNTLKSTEHIYVIHMFPYRYQRDQTLDAGDHQQRMNFASNFLSDMMAVITGLFPNYGRTRHMEPKLITPTPKIACIWQT